jgi:hypothetical protein
MRIRKSELQKSYFKAKELLEIEKINFENTPKYEN